MNSRKAPVNLLDRGAETLCAFLNGNGGTVLFGVTDEGKIKGQEVSDKTKKAISEAFSCFEPPVSPEISYIPLPNSDKMVIAVSVEADRFRRPFFIREDQIVV